MENFNTYLLTFWETITFEFVFKFALVYFFVIWIALLVWIIKDISIRTDNIYFQVLSVFIILFLTPLGVFIYLLIRPSKTLYEKYYDEIEDNLDIFHEIIEERKKELDSKENKEIEPKNNSVILEKEEELELEIENDQIIDNKKELI